MAARFKTAGVVALVIAVLALVLATSLRLILRYQPKPLVDATRTVFGRVLNPIVLWLSDRVDTEWQILHHVGRRTGREYRAPLCAAPTSEGYIVPAACGPDVDWLANLRATPQAKLTYGRVTFPVVAEVIDRQEALRLAGGSPGCPCWDQFRIQEFAVLRPDTDRSIPPIRADRGPSWISAASARHQRSRSRRSP